MANQAGHVFRKGDSWFLRYRDSFVRSVCAHCEKPRDKHGKESHEYEETRQLVRKQLCKKLSTVDPEHVRLKRPPQSVLDLAEEELNPVNSSNLEPGKNVSVQDFVANVYFPNIEGQKRASTVRGYRAIWESQLKARCGHFRLREFKTPQAHAVLADIGRANPKLTRSSLHNLRSLLSGIFRHAIQQGYLEGANPIREASIPRAPEGNETHVYSLPEVMQMLKLLPDPARTIVAVAAFLGLRRAEIRGLEWQDYSGDEIRVMRSVWESVTNEPKTRKSKAPVPVIGPMQGLLDQYRVSRGNPASGSMFATMKGTTPLNLNNVLNRQILPVLNVCVCGKAEDKHAKEDHEYQRSERPQWHGWHAFRRGLATNLHDLGVPDKTIQAILRHANVAITQNSYIKTLDAQSIAAMSLLESLVDVKLLAGNSESRV
jgi:integrase